MKEVERNMMCVLLQRLLDKNLITPKICENAKEKILDTLDGPDFFCYIDEKRGEESHGHAQNSC